MPKADRCAEPASGWIVLDEALSRMQALVQPVAGGQRIALRSALGRVLAEPIVAALDIPPFPSSAMDGYALHHADLNPQHPLRLIGVSQAGHPFAGALAPGTCVRILTGAVLPAGAAAVVPQENTRRDDNQVYLKGTFTAGDHVRPAGDDVRAGELLLPAGRRLTPADLGLLAASGQPEVLVRSRPRVAILATGDELRAVAEPLGPGEIHESNGHLAAALLADLAIEVIDLGIVPDDPLALTERLLAAAGDADAIITTGGASVGDADHLVEVLNRIGQMAFWKVAIKPGKPFAFGRIGDAWLFGLPGNPVAVAVTLRQLVRPILLRLMGTDAAPPLRLEALCAGRIRKAPGRQEFQRGMFWREPGGPLTVAAVPGQGSHRLSSLSRANCFIVLPLENAGVAPGDRVEIEPFDACTGADHSPP